MGCSRPGASILEAAHETIHAVPGDETSISKFHTTSRSVSMIRVADSGHCLPDIGGVKHSLRFPFLGSDLETGGVLVDCSGDDIAEGWLGAQRGDAGDGGGGSVIVTLDVVVVERLLCAT